MPPIGGSSLLCPIRASSIRCISMKFAFPGRKKHTVRFMERVETADPQYDILECGIEHPDGSVDSMVFGGSFASAKAWLSVKDATSDTSKETTSPDLKVA